MSSGAIASSEGMQQKIVQEFLDGSVASYLGLLDDDLEIALSVANNTLKSGKIEEAKGLYLALILCRPSEFRFQQGLANVCLREEEYGLVIGVAATMIMLNPLHPLGHYFYGVASFALRELEDATEHLSIALELAISADDSTVENDCLRMLERMRSLET